MNQNSTTQNEPRQWIAKGSFTRKDQERSFTVDFQLETIDEVQRVIVGIALLESGGNLLHHDVSMIREVLNKKTVGTRPRSFLDLFRKSG